MTTDTTALITDAIVERSRLDRKLSAQWAWFDTNPNHPDTEVKTEVFLRTLSRYESACDAVKVLDGESCP